MPQNQKTEGQAWIEEQDLPQLSVAEFEFVRCLVHKGMTASKAYRESHDCTDMSDSAVWSAASRLRGTARIQEHEQALLEWNMHRGAMDKTQFIAEMEGLARRAERAGNFGAAVRAKEQAGKVDGLYVEQIRDVSHEASVEDVLMSIEQLLGKEARDKAAREMGIFDQESVH